MRDYGVGVLIGLAVWAGLGAVALIRARRWSALAVLATGLAYGAVHFWVQGRGWEYHLYPLALFATALGGAGLGAALAGGRRALTAMLVLALVVTAGALWTKGQRNLAPEWIDEKLARVGRVSLALRPVVAAGGTVQVLDTAEGGIHALLRLRARQPSRFLYDFPFYHDVGHPYVRRLRAELMDALRAHPPAAVVVLERGWPEGGYERLAEFPELERWLQDDYRVAEEGDGYRLYVARTTTRRARREAIARVVEAYDGWVIRAYCRVRFLILRQRFLDEISQYLPPAGTSWTSAAASGSSRSITRRRYRSSVSTASIWTHGASAPPVRRGDASGWRTSSTRWATCGTSAPASGVRRRLHAGHRPPHRARERAAAPGGASRGAAARRLPRREGRGHAAGLQALVHPRARPPGESREPAALLGGGESPGRARGRGVPGVPARHGRSPAIPPRPVRLPEAAGPETGGGSRREPRDRRGPASRAPFREWASSRSPP